MTMIISLLLLVVICILLLSPRRYQPKPKYSKMFTSHYEAEIKSSAPKKFKIQINR